jgi:hypothetical protein
MPAARRHALAAAAAAAAAAVLVAGTAAAAQTVEVARDLDVQKALTVAGAVTADAATVNGTLTANLVKATSALNAGVVRAETVYADVISAKSGDTILVDGNLELSGAAAGAGAAPAAPLSFLATSVVIDGVKQWSLVTSENFDGAATAAPEWALTGSGHSDLEEDGQRLPTSTCGHPDDRFLGGPCNLAAGQLRKTFRNLPQHTEVRVKATLNFVDRWHGEQAYCKVGDNIAWLNTVGQPAGATAAAARVLAAGADEPLAQQMNVCGSPAPDLALGTSVDVSRRHSSRVLEVVFGTTLQQGADACAQSWGVDDVQIYVR